VSGTVRQPALRADELAKLSPSEQLERIVSAINQLSTEAGGALNRRLSILGNMRTHLFTDIPITTGDTVEDSFPLTLELGEHMPPKPMKVEVVAIRCLTVPAPPWTAAVHPFWELGGERLISITYISGLWANTRYVADFLVWS
jgi:hypothetical protein